MVYSSFDDSKEQISIDHFMNLSAEINYLLSSRRDDLAGLLAIVLGPSRNLEEFSHIIKRALRCIKIGYGKKTRRMGTPAVIHPIRTAAILSRVKRKPEIVDILGALLHDKLEDIDEAKLSDAHRERFNSEYEKMIEEIGAVNEWYLHERLALLTRIAKGEEEQLYKTNPTAAEEKARNYNKYISRILDNSESMPNLLHIKLADRLDNTLDTHLQRPGVSRYNFYRTVFDILFVPAYKGVQINEYHFLPAPEEGRQLLAQLFKNVLLLSMLRQSNKDKVDETSKILFDAVAVASIREAQWIGLELLHAHIKDPADQRKLLNELREYSISGGVTEIRRDDPTALLDGIILTKYAINDKKVRNRSLDEIYDDKRALASIVIAFIATFACFLNDDDFFIKGIDRTGIHDVGEAPEPLS